MDYQRNGKASTQGARCGTKSVREMFFSFSKGESVIQITEEVEKI